MASKLAFVTKTLCLVQGDEQIARTKMRQALASGDKAVAAEMGKYLGQLAIVRGKAQRILAQTTAANDE